MGNRAYKYRLYPTRKQERILFWTLTRCRELYNAALQERKDAYKMCKKSISYNHQAGQLPDIKELREECQDIYSQVLQDVLRRTDRAMQGFFRRVSNGEKPGYPRFQGRNRYNSFTYPQKGFSLEGNRLTLCKIGCVKVKVHRPLKGKSKTCTIKYEAGQWYVIVVCEVEGCAETSPPLEGDFDDAVGVDLGITHFAALSDGAFIDNPRYYRKGQAILKKRQQHLNRCKRGSHRREKARRAVTRAHRKIRNQRRDFLHKQSRKLVNEHRVIVFEELQMLSLVKCPQPKQDAQTGQYLPNGAAAKSGLNKSILDAGWGTFQQMCLVKAASAGRHVLFVNPYKTSQQCSGCGKDVPKPLEERWHLCPHCGLSLDRDHNAALNILRLGGSPQR